MTLKLSERAMLVTLRISSYTGLMSDPAVTESVHETFKAEHDAGRYGKQLIARKFMRPVALAHRQARDAHHLLTLPWEDDGTRIITTKGYIAYTVKMKEAKAKVEEEVRLFVSDLPSYVEEAKQRLGKMFNAEDYPSEDELASKFGFDVEVASIPEAADFRAKLSDEQTKHIIKDIEQRTNKRVEAAMSDVYERIVEMVGRFSDKLKGYQPPKENAKAVGIIRDSLVYSIYDFATNMMPILNITGDDKMEALRLQLLEELMEHSPEILRADPKVRQATAVKADKILKKVKQYLG